MCACVYRGQKGESEPSTSVTGVFNLLNVQRAKLWPLEEHYVPLATEPPLHPPCGVFSKMENNVSWRHISGKETTET